MCSYTSHMKDIQRRINWSVDAPANSGCLHSTEKGGLHQKGIPDPEGQVWQWHPRHCRPAVWAARCGAQNGPPGHEERLEDHHRYWSRHPRPSHLQQAGLGTHQAARGDQESIGGMAAQVRGWWAFVINWENNCVILIERIIAVISYYNNCNCNVVNCIVKMHTKQPEKTRSALEEWLPK